MNRRMIRYLLGIVIIIDGIVMLLPCLVALIYNEPNGIWFLIIGLAAICAGGCLAFIKKPKKTNIYAKEGFLTVALSWFIISIIGALPFYLSGEIPFFIDALFESSSGFTTTGASVVASVEALSKCMLFWRSLSIWLGGMGILVFIMAIIPLAGGSQNIHLMRAESPGPMVGKFLPRLRGSAVVLYVIYLFLTIVQFVLLILGEMPVFDAVNIAMSTAGTGGFAVTNAGIASYSSVYLQTVIAVFMALFGLNFAFYFLLLGRKFKQILRLEEIWWYIGIIVLSTVVIAFNIRNSFPNMFSSLNSAFFQVSSLMTSTGFATENYDLWPALSQNILLVLMCIGACAGSTGGGFKVSRVIILLKYSRKSLSKSLHPRNVKVVKMSGKMLDSTTVHVTSGYLAIYICFIIFSILLLSINGFDFHTTVSAVIATVNNTGPGFNLVGPTHSFAGFTPFSKVVLIINMIAGRLEFFPLLFMFSPSIWKK